VIYLTLNIKDMSQSRYAPRALDTQGHQGKEGRVHIFPSSHSKESPLSIDDCRSVPTLKARNARMQNSLDHIIPSYYSRARHESWSSRPTMNLEPPCLEFASHLENIILDQRKRIAGTWIPRRNHCLQQRHVHAILPSDFKLPS
jgi:hypothetical protein